MRCKSLILASLIFITTSTAFAAEKLVFALDLIRHGDRTPTDTIPATHHTWPQGLGQLTARGMRQEYDMGRAFRKRYIETEHLLPANYQKEAIYVRSTDYDRTLMSAQSLLMGLYPEGTGPVIADSNEPGLPRAFQPIPVHTAPKEFDRMIYKDVDPAEYKRLMRQYVFPTPEWQQRENNLRPNFARWSQLTGIEITSLEDLIYIGDTLFIHQLYNAPMPAGLSEEEIATIIENGKWAFMAEERPYPVATVLSSQVFGTITNFVKQSSRPDAKLKYVLLSAHDSTIASTLALMGAPLDTPPRYASDLNFAVYEKGASQYVVKISYNGEPVNIPACGGNICKLDTFLQMLK